MNDLLDCLMPYKTIATMGICKNAGKTTVLNHLIHGWHHSMALAITSIGYDGEATDGLTQLPKPRILVYPGMMAATCLSCLENSTAEAEIIEETSMETVLGRVVLVRCVEEGIMELSGPATRSQTAHIVKRLLALGAGKVVIDGAAGRTAFGTLTEATVLSVGAACGPTIEEVVEKGGFLAEKLSVEKWQGMLELPCEEPWVKLTEQEGSCYLFRGLVADRDVLEIMKEDDRKKIIIAKDPSALFLEQSTYRKFIDRGGRFAVKTSISLKAITVNPMNPFGAWLDPLDLERTMRERTPLPVFNVGREV